MNLRSAQTGITLVAPYKIHALINQIWTVVPKFDKQYGSQKVCFECHFRKLVRVSLSLP